MRAGDNSVMENTIAYETVNTAESTVLTVIWLHGLGADGHDFMPLVPELQRLGIPETKFVFPHAPRRPVTINNGMVMRAWYDIKSFDAEGRADREGVHASTDLVRDLIRKENEAGRPNSRIVLAGFSQGGAIALHLGAQLAPSLAGLIALSTYIPLEPEFLEHASATDMPVMVAHGTHDPVVPVMLGERARDLLEEKGFSVSFTTYPMQHAVHPDEVAAVAEFLRSVAGD